MSTFLAGLLLLGVLVVFHEFGHFIVAKWCGVRVLTFSVGFGPKIASFTYGETEYRISILPLGGYVRMYGDQIDEDVPEEEKKYSFLHQPVWKKSAIAFAGPLFNFILPIFLFFFVFLGTEQFLEPIIGSVAEDSPAQKAGFLPGDRFLSINGVEVDTFTDAMVSFGQNPDKKLDVEVFRTTNGQKSTISLVVTPESVPDVNPLNPGEQMGDIGIVSTSKIPMIAVALGSSAYEAGLRSGDIVLKVEDKAIRTYEDLEATLKSDSKLTVLRKGRETNYRLSGTSIWHPKKAVGFQKFGVMGENLPQEIEGWIADSSKHLSKMGILAGISYGGLMVQNIVPESAAAGLGMQPGDTIHYINGQRVFEASDIIQIFSDSPEIPHVMGYISGDTSKVAVFRLLKKDGGGIARAPDQYFLGVAFAQAVSPGVLGTQQIGPGGALVKSLEATKNGFEINLKSLWLMATFQVSANNIGGPIAIFGVAGQAADRGASVYIFIMCLISIGLGILNLLPIPALDGGHLLMFFIEAIQGKPLSVKTRGIATQIGVTMLLMLMGFAIFNDLSQLFG